LAKLKYKLTRDTLFKLFFVKYPDLLKDLVSRFLGIAENDITEFVITNPIIAPDSLGTKFCRLDINMKVNGQNINLEVQVEDKKDYPARSLYYWARCYSSALFEGGSYIDLPKTIVINILDFELFPDNDGFYSEFRALEVTRHTELTDKMSLHYFELTKLPEIEKLDVGDGKNLWLALFSANTDEEMSKVEKIGGDIMAQAVAAYKSVVASDDLKEIERLRELAEFNERSARNYERQEGLREGLQEGMKEQLRKNVLSMYQKAFTVEEIARVLDISGKEVKDILGL
jgi:predicted transposase/invertase (TIGR01784 family)